MGGVVGGHEQQPEFGGHPWQQIEQAGHLPTRPRTSVPYSTGRPPPDPAPQPRAGRPAERNLVGLLTKEPSLRRLPRGRRP
ncbi:hypothetical protein [Streptomyces sp. NBC_01451]|uniref:hypothetical protein n=1 Tax=Streptomyces sp. NBC_01451 TaxID=2903872 RepID=UPI002E34C8BE|nr:hypothetical protein [Streptomyces sp. NBC_01451]